MGTNYYLKKDDESIHIGKSSVGWAFLVNARPEDALMTWPDILSDIQVKLSNGWKIFSEYEEEVSLEALRKTVEQRPRWATEIDQDRLGPGCYYDPKIGLARHCVTREGRVTWNGEGTWDLIVAEFS